jgi:hypothetical protein
MGIGIYQRPEKFFDESGSFLIIPGSDAGAIQASKK